MSAEARFFPLLLPLQRLADFYEYLLNSQSFNMVILQEGKGVRRVSARGWEGINIPLMVRVQGKVGGISAVQQGILWFGIRVSELCRIQRRMPFLLHEHYRIAVFLLKVIQSNCGSFDCGRAATFAQDDSACEETRTWGTRVRAIPFIWVWGYRR